MRDPIPCPMCGELLSYFGEAMMCSYTCNSCSFRMSCCLQAFSDFAKFEAIVKQPSKVPHTVFLMVAHAVDIVRENAGFTIIKGLGEGEPKSKGREIMQIVDAAWTAAMPYAPKPDYKINLNKGEKKDGTATATDKH